MRPKILLLDDDQDLLDLYKEILGQLPCGPEIQTASSGARAITLLEGEAFDLLITDLNMPKMDGLQVLSIVRRKYPKLRIVVMTSVMDEQFRSRSYALGVDLFWQKPSTMEEIKLFLECIESLIVREEQQGGFRGVQSKSLVDIIQLECLSQSSCVLKVVNGALEGRIWFQDGDIIDATCQDHAGEIAVREIMSWKTGNFEMLPADPTRPRQIHGSSQGLLLEVAQAIDEAQGQQSGITPDGTPIEQAGGEPPPSKVATLARSVEGLEFLLAVPDDAAQPVESWGAENAKPVGDWVRQVAANFRSLGERMLGEQLVQIECMGVQRQMFVTTAADVQLCAAWSRSGSLEQARDNMKKLLSKWAS